MIRTGLWFKIFSFIIGASGRILFLFLSSQKMHTFCIIMCWDSTYIRVPGFPTEKRFSPHGRTLCILDFPMYSCVDLGGASEGLYW